MNAKTKNTKKKKRTINNANKSNLVVKRIVTAIAVIGIFTAIYSIYQSDRYAYPTQICSLPLIQTQSYSSGDNAYHVVKTNVDFSVDSSLMKEYDEAQILEITTKTIEGCDYSKLNQPYGTEYLKEEIKQNIFALDPDIYNENFEVYISGYDLGLVNGYLPGLILDENVSSKSSSQKLQQMFGS